MYVKPKTTEEKLIDFVKELAHALENAWLPSDNRNEDWWKQNRCIKALNFAYKADKRRNEIYKQQGETL